MKGNLSLIDEFATLNFIDHQTMPGMQATGKTATWQEIHITRFAEGKAVEHWAVVDQHSMLAQLGFVEQNQRVAAGR